jgi:hypothetical protein
MYDTVETFGRWAGTDQVFDFVAKARCGAKESDG